MVDKMTGEVPKIGAPETYQVRRAEQRARGRRQEMRQVAAWMDRVISGPSDETIDHVLGEVREPTRKFPAPGISA